MGPEAPHDDTPTRQMITLAVDLICQYEKKQTQAREWKWDAVNFRNLLQVVMGCRRECLKKFGKVMRQRKNWEKVEAVLREEQLYLADDTLDRSRIVAHRHLAENEIYF